ncbi:MAG: dTDP-4-dehydrorhamnose reductase [Acidimicrobiales bacterium]
MRVLVTGASGQVGSAIVQFLETMSESRIRDRLDVIAADHSRLDVSVRDHVLAAIGHLEPDVVFHVAASTAVDACELQPDRAFQVNALGTRHVAEAARRTGSHVVYLSTDYVFDGTSDRPYVEWDPPNPLSVYGRSKLAGELEMDPSWTIVRTAWVVGRNGANMVKTVLGMARGSQDELRFVADQHGCPTVAEDLAGKVIELGLARRPGRYHVTNTGETTWYEFAREVLRFAGLDPERVLPIKTSDLSPERYPAPRPANSVLDNAALRLSGDALLPEWRASVARLVTELG